MLIVNKLDKNGYPLNELAKNGNSVNKIYRNGEVVFQNVTVTKVTAITLDNLVWATNIPWSGGTATKDNCTYSVTAYYSDGTTVDVTSEATITGSKVIPSTNIGEVHSAGTLTLTASYSGFTATGNVTVYQEAATSDFSTKPLTFNILSAGTIIWRASNTSIAKRIEYKLNNGAWVSITSNTSSSAPTITVNSGDKLQFRGNNAQYANSSSKYNSFSGSTASFEAEGNVMSLIYGDNFKNKLTISSTYAFANLFRNCVNLVSAENLVLPATTLANYCYCYMFYGCTSLTTVPSNLLPATTLADYCYQNMFQGCTSLTTAPELPATTLASSCYSQMFQGCNSLTTAPGLPATTLANYCYQGMFWNCESLTTAPVLPATTLANYCYQYMFQGCASLTTAPALPATTLKDSCYNGMFNDTNVLPDCSNIDFASSTVVASGGLKGLFSGTKVTDNDLERLLPKNDNGRYYLPATTLASSCYKYMFEDCKSLTTAPELPATTLVGGCYQNMFKGCTSLNYIKCLATDISASNCTSNWVSGVASTGTFVKNPNTAWKRGTSGIPNGWAIIDA